MPFSGCVLKSEGTNLAVALAAGKQCIGRSRETRIKDTRCSKKQGTFLCCMCHSFENVISAYHLFIDGYT